MGSIPRQGIASYHIDFPSLRVQKSPNISDLLLGARHHFSCVPISEGRGANTVIVFRGPGFLIGGFCGKDDIIDVNVVGEILEVERLSGRELSVLVSLERSAHFSASTESSGTSTISLSHKLLSTCNKRIIAGILSNT